MGSIISEGITIYDTIYQRFSFKNNLKKLETLKLQSAASHFVRIYTNDLEFSLGNEFIQF